MLHKNLPRNGAALALLSSALFGLGCESEPEIPKLELVTTELPDVRLGAPYEQKVAARGGVPPYSFQISQGSLPNGLVLGTSTGQIAGTAASPGAHAFSLGVRDSTGDQAFQQLSIYVTPDTLELMTRTVAEAQETIAYEQDLVARGGVPPYSYKISSGSLPDGLELVADQITGVPTAPGLSTFVVEVSDVELKTATADLMLVVRSLNPMIRTSTIPSAGFGRGYRVELEADGGRPPYLWSLASGALPLGVALGGDGIINGAPLDAGDFVFVTRVTDAGGRTDEAMWTLHVVPPLQILTQRLPQVLAGRPYEFQMEASGGRRPYSWALVSGLVPGGLTLESDGRIHGIAVTAARQSVVLAVTDSAAEQKAGSFIFEVNDRHTYSVSPELQFPASCTSTSSVSDTSVQILVEDSMQIEDIDVAVDLAYSDPTAPANNRNRYLKVVLIAPNGQRAALCGAAAGLRQEPGCRGSGGINTSYDDASQSFTPLRVFRGMNPQGIWTLRVTIPRGEFGADQCRQSGTIHSVSLKIREDQDTSPYIRVTGFDTNELIIDPYVRVRYFDSLNERDIYLSATKYDVGPNGFREGGMGDDVPDLTSLFTWTYNGPSTLAVTLSPDGHIEGQSPDRSCLVSGRRCGTGEAEAVAEDGLGNEVRKRFLVVPPEWNPLSRVF